MAAADINQINAKTALTPKIQIECEYNKSSVNRGEMYYYNEEFHLMNGVVYGRYDRTFLYNGDIIIESNDELGVKKKRKDLLLKKFKLELTKYSSYLDNTEEAVKAFDEVVSNIQEINYKDAVVEITPNNAIKFTLAIDSDKIIMITKPLGDILDVNPNEVIFSIFVDRELMSNGTNKLNTLVQGINKYLAM